MAITTGPARDDAGPRYELPPPYTFAIGEHVTGLGVNGKIVDRPGPYSVTVIQNGVRLSASVVHAVAAGGSYLFGARRNPDRDPETDG